ncbi:MAG: hypothetical protein [Wendovervirus sonii]|uniref:Uncharacterized protein n=1 Tax=phage Lak_Megaphage_Sonny TaxID=3109229 RepID=A0ABZ0Z3R8_9CAUD|nr:MAG: hypothetical protein [phage Lak_Megaphage_Sonny]
MDRINTSKTLHNSYFDGDNYDLHLMNAPMHVHSDLSSQYDYALTDNPELLQDRKNSAELIYQIFTESVYNDGRFLVIDTSIIKVPKDNIAEVFKYVKTELVKVKKLNPAELIIAINEFFDFNYDFVYKKVLTPQMKQELLEDLYNNEGLQKNMDEGSSIKLF